MLSNIIIKPIGFCIALHGFLRKHPSLKHGFPLSLKEIIKTKVCYTQTVIQAVIQIVIQNVIQTE